MDMLNHGYKILSWNAWGLNSVAKQEDVKKIINLFNPGLLCLQETKLASFDVASIINCLGGQYENSYAFLPADGTRASIILAANNSSMTLSSLVHTNHTLSSQILDIKRKHTWTATAVYGPQRNLETRLFISELRSIKQYANPHWLVLGDFNLIYKD
jgi:exonuclease III